MDSKKLGLSSLARKFVRSFCTTSFLSLRTRLLRSFSRHPSFVVRRHLATPLACNACARSSCGTFVVCARYGELFKTSETSEPVVRAVFGLSVFPFVRENERRKQGSKVYGQQDDSVGAV
jgi:hypothetical protein